jgi:folate-binding protein YgfZ
MANPAHAEEAALAREYAAGRERAALAPLARGTLDVTGPKRQDFLHSMLSNEVQGLGPGQGRRAASMTAKGSLQALLRVLVDKSVVVLETEQDRLEPVLRTLEFHKVGAPVRFALAGTGVLALFGPQAAAVLGRAGAEAVPAADEAHVSLELGGAPARLVRASDLPGAGFVVHAPLGALDAVAAALREAGAEPIGREALDALRVESLVPWYGSDVAEDNLLHETGLLQALHSSTKGCYVGQEVIARLEGRGGNVNKALRRLRLSAPVVASTPLTAEGKEVGWLTTVAVSPRHGPIALGYVHRSHFAPGSALDAAGARATVVASFEDVA